jgi:inositol oxygenase
MVMQIFILFFNQIFKCYYRQHSFQSASRAADLFPGEEFEFLHLTALIHDLGKILSVKTHPGDVEPLAHWATVGDTIPVGCAVRDECVFSQVWRASNPDRLHPVYSTRLGIYSEGCGLDKVHFSWSHDEYLAALLEHNEKLGRLKRPLDRRVPFIIRYHSFYPWHDLGAYNDLASDSDRSFLPYVKLHQLCDLYSKADEKLEGEAREVEMTTDVQSRASQFLKVYRGGYFDQLVDKFIGRDTLLKY